VAGDPNTLWCLNKTTGETVWKWDYKFPDKNGQDFSNLAIVKDRLYVITGDSILWCFGSGPSQVANDPSQVANDPSQVANEVVNKLPDYTPMFAGIIAAVVVSIIIGLYSIYDHRKLRK
jgi:hypothetical protein